VNLGLYVHRNSPLHRWPAGAKLAGLFVAGISVFMISDPRWLVVMLAVVVGLFVVGQVPVREALRQLRPAAILIAIIFLVHGAFTSWELGFLVVLRFAILLLLAVLLTFTTRVSDMIDTLERALAPFTPLGVNPAKVSLTLSLALRFIPLLFDRFGEIREAQRARGLDRNIFALLMPLMIKTLKMADNLTEAIEARGYNSQHRPAKREQ